MKPTIINKTFANSQDRYNHIKKYCERPYKLTSAPAPIPATQEDMFDEFVRFQTSLESTPDEQTDQWTTAMLKDQIFG